MLNVYNLLVIKQWQHIHVHRYVHTYTYLQIIKQHMKGLGYTSVVQSLPSMLEALGLIPASKKKRQKKYHIKKYTQGLF
jgi:hypothetical protein